MSEQHCHCIAIVEKAMRDTADYLDGIGDFKRGTPLRMMANAIMSAVDPDWFRKHDPHYSHKQNEKNLT